MSDEIESLRAEVAALRAELAESREQGEQAVTRRRLLTGLLGAGAATAAGVAGARPAAAANGDSLVLGAQNTAASTTTLGRPDETDTTTTFVVSGTEEALWALSPNLAIRASSDGTAVRANGDVAVEAIGDGTCAVSGSGTGDATGILAFSAEGDAVSATAPNRFAVWGNNFAPGIPAVHGVNSSSGPGLGAASSDHGPQLVLARENLPTPGPPSTYADAGSIRFDSEGDLWLCLATGAPGTWTRLLREDTTHGRTVPITPFRALDTRATGGRAAGAPVVPGQRKGPLRGGQSVTLDLGGVNPIPTTATGVVGNATVILPSASGYLRILPAGASVPAASFNFAKGITEANGFTSALPAAGIRATAPISSSITYHLVIDIAAYIT